MSNFEKVLNQVRATITEHNMLCDKNRVVIGVSGGVDSVVLLHCLCALREEYKLDLVVAHINHKIRKETAERDARFVEELCKELNIEFKLAEFEVEKIASESGKTVEEVGRECRYSFFEELAGEYGTIVTAHNANDNVETVLMRLMRGTGVKGLSGIPYVRNKIVRPLLDVSRDDIEVCGFEHITDETNDETVYTRNKIRLGLIPYIQKEFNPNIINTINTNCKSFREDTEYFDNVVENMFCDYCVVEGDRVVIDYSALGEDPSIAKRLIVRAVRTFLGVEQICISADVLDKVYNCGMTDVGKTFVINKDCKIVMSHSCVIVKGLEDSKNNKVYYWNPKENDCIECEDFGITIKTKRVKFEEFETFTSTPEKFYIPMTELCGTCFEIRTRREGDYFKKDYWFGKKLNEVFIDEKVDRELRDNIPVLYNRDDHNVYWVYDKFVTRFNMFKGDFLEFTVEKK